MSFKKKLRKMIFGSEITTKINHQEKEEKTIIIDNIEVRPIYRRTQDIQTWRTAMRAAEGAAQQRRLLYDLYDEIMLDTKLKSAIRDRVANVTNRDLTFMIDGKVDKEIVRLTNTTFFKKLTKEFLNSKFYGHSLIEVNWSAPGAELKGTTEVVDRRHVKPRFGIVTKDANGTEGLPYREKPFSDFAIEAGEKEDLGCLLEVAQYVIYKKGNFGDWAEYAELFGMPFRWATYTNEQSRVRLEKAMAESGSAGYVVAPEDANLSYHSPNTSTSSDIFKELREACNEEITIGILGNTLTTTNGKNSGYAQSKTHRQGQNEISKDDRKSFTLWLNEKLVPVLKRLGYNPGKGVFSFVEEETLPLTERFKIDLALNDIIPFPENYWYEKYKIPKPESGELVTGPNNLDPTDSKIPKVSKKEKTGEESETKTGEGPDPESDDKPEPGKRSNLSDPQKKKAVPTTKVDPDPDPGEVLELTDQLDTLYGIHQAGCNCEGCTTLNLRAQKLDPRFRKITNKLETDFIKRLLASSWKQNYVDPNLYREYYRRLVQFAQLGFGGKFFSPENLEQLRAIEGLRRNLSKFAAHKTVQVTRQLDALKVLPRKDAAKAAKKILKVFNGRYLQAEVQTAMASADAIKRWADFEERKELYPNLRYDAVQDERTRPEHMALDGIIKPVDDEFWNTYMPPNGYRCRCIVIQTDDQANDIADPDFIPPKGLRNNAGRTGEAFGNDHPYFDVSPEEINEIRDAGEAIRVGFELSKTRTAAKKLVGQKFASNGQSFSIDENQLMRILNGDHPNQATINQILAHLDLVVPALAFDFSIDQHIINFAGLLITLEVIDNAIVNIS